MDRKIFAHRSLQPDSQFTGVVALRDLEGKFSLIAVAQGTKMHFIDITSDSYRIIKTFPFMSPIEVIESGRSENKSVFILLRNLNWFIFEDSKLSKSGSFKSPFSEKCKHFIYQRINPFLPEGLYSGSSIEAIKNIKYAESRILHASHPKFVALHIFHNLIHIIPLEKNLNNFNSRTKKSKIYKIHLTDPNIVDIAFFGPFTCSARLAVLSDVPNGGNRMLNVFSMNEDQIEFSLEFSCSVPHDSYLLLPLHPDLHSTIDIFTNDGLIRITAPEGLRMTVEHLSSFMPPTVLHACHFYDDIYLLVDSGGILTGAVLPVDGNMSTESMKIVGPCSGVLAFDKNRFIIISPFGDSIVYNFSLKENRFTLTECTKFECPGPINCLEFRENDDGLICGVGQNDKTSIRLFERAVSCKKTAEIPFENCLAIFTAESEDPAKILICLCMFNATFIIKFDGKTADLVNWPDFDTKKNTIFFSDGENGTIIVVSDKEAMLIDRRTGSKLNDCIYYLNTNEKRTTNDSIVAATTSKSTLVIADDTDVIHVLNSRTLKKVKRLRLNKQIILIAATDENIAVYLFDNTVFLFFLADLKNVKTISLPIFTSPVSLAIVSSELVILGTGTGYLLKITDSFTKISSENVGEGKTVIHVQKDNTFLCSGTPPFQLTEEERNFICCCPCDDIGRSSNFLCCLQQSGISIYTVDELLIGKMKVKQSIPNMISFVFDSEGCIIMLKDDKEGQQSIVKYKRGIEISRFDMPTKKHRISFCTHFELNGECITVIGDDTPSITLLDKNQQKVSWQKMLSTPYAATKYASLMVVSRVGAIDFYDTKNLDGQIEMDRKFIAEGHLMTLDFLVVGDFLIASDVDQSLIVYTIDKANSDSIVKVHQDFSVKHLTNLVLFANTIFAASIDSTIYAYDINLETGVTYELGSFQCDSRVLSFAVNDNFLYFGTEGGGIGFFEKVDDEDYVKLRDEFEQLDLTIVADREAPAIFEYEENNPFVDIENLKLINQLPKAEFTSFLATANVSSQKFSSMDIH